MLHLRAASCSFAVIFVALGVVHAADPASCSSTAASAPSLLQVSQARSDKSLVTEGQVAPCAVIAQGACWFLSELSETCAATCARQGRTFSFVAADPADPIMSKLLDHDPISKEEPWGVLECYAPDRDLLHPANVNGAKQTTGQAAGNWQHEGCKLACPCGAAALAAPAGTPVAAPVAVTPPAVAAPAAVVGGCKLLAAGDAAPFAGILASNGAAVVVAASEAASVAGYLCPPGCAHLEAGSAFAADGSFVDDDGSAAMAVTAGGVAPVPGSLCGNVCVAIAAGAAVESAGTFTAADGSLVGRLAAGALAPAAGSFCTDALVAALGPVPSATVPAGPGQGPLRRPQSLPPGLPGCAGVSAQGRCWLLSELGASCNATCNKTGLVFALAVPEEMNPIMPLLLDHDPTMKEPKWAAFECYAPDRDLYHLANANAAKHLTAAVAATWSYPTCKLACPCGTPAVAAAAQPEATAAPRVAASPMARSVAATTVTTTTARSTEAPPPGCDGLATQGRCWFLSELGSTCNTTCAKNGRSFSFQVADAGDAVGPKLLGHDPAAKEAPWGVLECYAPDRDLFHPANGNAARHTTAEVAANWSFPTCKLSCPCGDTLPLLPTPTEAPEAPEASVKRSSPAATTTTTTLPAGREPGCAGVVAQSRCWLLSDVGEACNSTCARDGREFNFTGADNRDPVMPKLLGRNMTVKESPWAVLECFMADRNAFRPANLKVPKRLAEDAAKWRYPTCQLSCPCSLEQPASTPKAAPPKAAPAVEAATAAPTEAEGPCARHPELDHDEVGAAVSLDESGYQACVASEHPIKVKRFICRLATQLGCKVVDNGGLMGFLPHYSSATDPQTYAHLESELETLCHAGGKWITTDS